MSVYDKIKTIAETYLKIEDQSEVVELTMPFNIANGGPETLTSIPEADCSCLEESPTGISGPKKPNTMIEPFPSKKKKTA